MGKREFVRALNLTLEGERESAAAYTTLPHHHSFHADGPLSEAEAQRLMECLDVDGIGRIVWEVNEWANNGVSSV